MLLKQSLAIGFVWVSLLFCLTMPQASRAAEYLYLAQPNHAITEISVDNDTAVFGIATWCAHCKTFTAFLKDSELAPYFKNKRFFFVFGNEWPKIGRAVKAELQAAVKAGEIESAKAEELYQQRLSALKQKAGNGLVYNPSVLPTLPGQYYFITPESQKQSNVSLKFFPSCYSPQSKAFDGDAMAWVEEHTEIPKDLLMKKARQYKLVSE